MIGFAKRNWKMLMVGGATGLFVLALATLSGCSTVSGFAQDLGDMSTATRSAMVKE